MSFNMKRAWVRRISALAATALLFAQISVAAYACPGLSKSAGAGASTMAEQGQQSDAGRDVGHPPLCHEHCKAQVGADQAQVVGVPAAMPSGLVISVVDVHHAVLRVTHAAPDPARVNHPPCSILFCVLRN
jgi:hypothetical protein